MGSGFYTTNDSTSVQSFLSTLFEPDDEITFGKTIYTYESKRLKDINALQAYEYICINPGKGRKAVDRTAFRNFLFEIDSVDLRAQLDHIRSIELPFSTLTFSGNKSFHFIISLDEELDSREQYDFVWTWISNIISINDKQTRDPNRLSRFPDHLREDNGRKQRLLIVKGRVQGDTLLEWLLRYPDCRPVRDVTEPSAPAPQRDRKRIVDDMLWYVQDFCGIQYRESGVHVQCPVCASEGKDRAKDNMFISTSNMAFHCFANGDHNRTIYKFVRRLRFI